MFEIFADVTLRPHLFNADIAAAFEPNAPIDSAHAALFEIRHGDIVHRLALRQRLLAGEARIDGTIHTDYDRIFRPLLNRGRRIELERRKRADVAADILPVDPHPRVVIDAVETEIGRRAGKVGRHLQLAAEPNHAMIIDPLDVPLRWDGHALPLRNVAIHGEISCPNAFMARIEMVEPAAVERNRLPLVAERIENRRGCFRRVCRNGTNHLAVVVKRIHPRSRLAERHRRQIHCGARIGYAKRKTPQPFARLP